MSTVAVKTLVVQAVEDSHKRLQESVRALVNAVFINFLDGLAVGNQLVYGADKTDTEQYVEYILGNTKLTSGGAADPAEPEVYLIINYGNIRFSAKRKDTAVEINLGDMRTPMVAIEIKDWLDGLALATDTNFADAVKVAKPA